MSSELFVSRFGGKVWAALREDGETVELRVDHGPEAGSAGGILKARVSRVLPGMQSAFLDIGLDRDAFLHVSDLLLPEDGPPEVEPQDEIDPDAELDPEDAADGADERSRPWQPATKRHAPIQDRLREGRELVVQVVRGPIRSKGPRVSCYVAIPGRYLVFLPGLRVRGVSRRIADAEERDRLRGILHELPDEGGFIVRTAGEGATEEAFRADAGMLGRLWREIRERAASSPAPAVLHSELDLLLRLLRDAPNAGYSIVVVDGDEPYRRAVEYLREIDPELASRVRLHDGREPLFQAYGLDADIERALKPKVWLRSGGSVVLEQTEALVSIDVNTGKYVGRRELEETVLRTNLEAAVEIARQLRLRDLGGIIVIDFIDMSRAESRREVLAALEDALRKDPARTKIVGLSDLGLVQLTRKRIRPGLAGQLTRECPRCCGRGRVLRAEVVASDAILEVRRLLPVLDRAHHVEVHARPGVAREVLRLLESEGLPGEPGAVDRIRVREDESAPVDSFEIHARSDS